MFVLGLKTAALANHSDGTEFKIQDTDPAPYAAGSGPLAPAGIPTYQPDGKSKWSPVDKSKKKDDKALDVALGKIATADVGPGFGSELDYVGTKSDAADTLATQLKWDSTSPEQVISGPSSSKRKDTTRSKVMQKFTKGFDKVAFINWKKLKDTGSSLLKGIRESGSDTLADTAKMKGLKHLTDAAKKPGKTSELIAHAIGRSSPSVAAGAAYTYGLKKLYDKATESPYEQYYQQ